MLSHKAINLFLMFFISTLLCAQIKKADSLDLMNRYDLGLKYYENGSLDSAKSQFLNLITLLNKYQSTYPKNTYLDEHMINSMDYLSSILFNLGNMPEAIVFANKVLKHFEEKQDSINLAISLNNVAYMYQSQDMFEKAKEYNKKALNIFSKYSSEESKMYISVLYNNMGLIYERKNIYDTTLIFYHKSLIIRRAINDKRGISESLNNIGNTLRKQNKLDESLTYLLEAQLIKEEVHDNFGLSYTLNNISIIYFLKGDYKKSQEYAIKSNEIALKVGNIDVLAQINKSLSKNFFQFGNYREAYNHLQEFILYNDSLKDINNKKAFYKSQVQYEFDKKETEIKTEQKMKDAITVREKQKQKIILYAVAGVLIIVIVFSFFLYNRFKTTQRQKHIIEAQKKIVEEQKHIVEEKQKEILDSITYAKRLQEAILPPPEFIDKNIPNNFVLYKPKDLVAGDFYWAELIDDLFFIAAADSTGHGVPGAMVSVVCSNALNRSVKEFGMRDTGQILNKARELVLETFAKSGEEIKDGMDISLLCIDKKDQKLFWSGANNALWYIKNNQLIEIKANKQPIGKTDDPKPFIAHQIEYDENVMFYLMTDGYPDQFGGPRGKKFKYKQLETLLLSIHQEPLATQKIKLDTEFDNWRGNLEQVDDVCIIGLKI